MLHSYILKSKYCLQDMYFSTRNEKLYKPWVTFDHQQIISLNLVQSELLELIVRLWKDGKGVHPS